MALGVWVNTQRAAHREGKLTRERVARLEALPGWKWEAIDEAWERAFRLVEGFVAREGHARVPQGHKADGFALGAWAAVQRGQHRRGSLPAERAARLEALPGWEWSPRRGPRR